MESRLAWVGWQIILVFSLELVFHPAMCSCWKPVKGAAAADWILAMTTIEIFSSIGLGFFHGYVTWNLIFQIVRPIVRKISPHHERRLPIAEGTSHVVVFLFLLTCTFLLISLFSHIVVAEPTRELKGYVFIGSIAGWICSGAIPRIEAGLRRKKGSH